MPSSHHIMYIFVVFEEKWRLPFSILCVECCVFSSFISSFDHLYTIFAVMYFVYDKSFCYLNNSICKVINFFFSSLAHSKKEKQAINWNERDDTCRKSIYIMIVYYECLFSCLILKWPLLCCFFLLSDMEFREMDTQHSA